MTEPAETSWAPPSEALLAANKRMVELVADVEARVMTRVSEWEQAIETHVREPLASVLADADHEHETLRSALTDQLADLEPTADEYAASRWRAYAAYADHVRVQCLRPVLLNLKESAPLAQLQEVHRARIEAILAEADTLPEEIEVSRSLEIWSETSGAGLLRSAGKLVASARDGAAASLRKAGNVFSKEPRQLDHPSRTVRLREVVRGRLESKLLTALDTEWTRLDGEIRQVLRDVEQDCWRWATECLKFLVEQDHGTFHVPAKSRLRVRRPEPSGGKQAMTKSDGAGATPAGGESAQDGPTNGSTPSGQATSGSASRSDSSSADDSGGGDKPPEPSFLSALSLTQYPLSSALAPPAEDTNGPIRNDLAVAGTLLYRAPETRPPRTIAPGTEPFVIARLELIEALITFRWMLRDVEESLLKEIWKDALRPIETTYDAVGKRLAELAELASGIARKGDHTTAASRRARVADRLEALLEKSNSIEDLYRDFPGLSSAVRVLSDTGEGTWRAIIKQVAKLPTELEMRSVVGETPRIYRMQPLALARSAFERPLGPRIQTAIDPLRRGISRVWNETEHVKDVVANTFHTAIQQLETSTEEDDVIDPLALESEETERSVGAAQSAEDIVSAGLLRASESLEDRYQSISREWTDLAQLIHSGLAGDWISFARNVQSEDFLAKQLLDLQTRVVRGAERNLAKAKGTWGKVATSTVALGRLGRIRARNLIRIGRSAVGVSRSTVEERHKALDIVASARSIYANLPLMYRRLFTPDPIADAGLAENRDDDLRAATDLVARWRKGIGPGVIVLHAPLGSGRTSFLRLLEAQLVESYAVRQIALTRRHRTEEALAAGFSEALFPDEDPVADFDALERLIYQRFEDKSTAVLIDNLEMLLFQASGGTDLLHRMMLFCIRTDDKVVWLNASASLGWDFAQKTAPGATRMAISHRLRPWSVESLRGVILTRHRRSGIPLEFQMPDAPSALVKQRIRRAKSPEAVQRILQNEFFEALAKTAGQSPTRALFEWVRAANFGEGQETLRMAPIASVSFAYLNQFDNDIALAMRALLLHNVMTIEEHSELFRTGISGAISTFEILLSAGLIEPADPSDEAAIVPGTRYRLRRLVLEPVSRSLRERNFIY